MKLNFPSATMGHRRLYHTPEEKKAAKAAKSKRSYIRFVLKVSWSHHSTEERLLDTEMISTSSDGKNIINITFKSKPLLKSIYLTLLINGLRNRERETQGPVPVTVQSTLESKVGFYLDHTKSI
jgi:hypothetical protein